MLLSSIPTLQMRHCEVMQGYATSSISHNWKGDESAIQPSGLSPGSAVRITIHHSLSGLTLASLEPLNSKMGIFKGDGLKNLFQFSFLATEIH